MFHWSNKGNQIVSVEILLPTICIRVSRYLFFLEGFSLINDLIICSVLNAVFLSRRSASFTMKALIYN